jgi:hypothetical protein
MSRDLQLSPSMVTFDDLDDLLGAIDDSIDVHKRAIERYSNILGGVLRTTLGESSVQEIQEESRAPSSADGSHGGSGRFGLFKSQPSGGNVKKVAKDKQDQASAGWTIVETEDFALKIATGTSAQVNSKRTESLFKIVEALKSKLTMLEIARKSLSELPSRGLRANQIIFVVFKDGIPKQIIPSNESASSRNKFAFQADFDVETMRVR